MRGTLSGAGAAGARLRAAAGLRGGHGTAVPGDRTAGLRTRSPQPYGRGGRPAHGTAQAGG